MFLLETGLVFSLVLMQDYQPELFNPVSRQLLMNPVMILCVGVFIFMTQCTSLSPLLRVVVRAAQGCIY